jgi:hypothetical protein
MGVMSDQEKTEFLAALVKQSKDLLEQAKEFADKHAMTFRWDEDYGAEKQWYVGRGSPTRTKEGEWTSSSNGC